MQMKLSYLSAVPELNLLLSLCLGTAQSVTTEGMDSERFSFILNQSCVTPLAAAGMKRLASADPQDSLLTAIRDGGAKNALTCMRQFSALAEVVGYLDDCGIRVLSYKGPILAAQVYGNAALRMSRDLDIWVDPKEFERAKSCLEMHNLRRLSEPEYAKTPKRKELAKLRQDHHAEYACGNVEIEMHWRLSDYRSPNDAQRTFDEAWSSRAYYRIANRDIPIWSGDEYICFLVEHAAHHQFYRLRWLMDLYFILRDKQGVAGLLDASRRLGAEVMVLEAMLLLLRVEQFDFDSIEIPELRMRRTGVDVEIQCGDSFAESVAWAAELSEYAWMALNAGIDTELTYATKAHGRLQKKRMPAGMLRVMSMLDILQPGAAEWRRYNLPDSLYFLYYPIRLIRLIGKKLGIPQDQPSALDKDI